MRCVARVVNAERSYAYDGPHMGWFDKLLGRESKEPTGPEDIKKSWKKGWESHGDEAKQMATTQAYLEAVGRAL